MIMLSDINTAPIAAGTTVFPGARTRPPPAVSRVCCTGGWIILRYVALLSAIIRLKSLGSLRTNRRHARFNRERVCRT
jgi:hypothetical protein